MLLPNLYVVISALVTASVEAKAGFPSPTVHSKTLIARDFTNAPVPLTTPASSVSDQALETSIAVVTAANGDLEFSYPPKLQSQLSDTMSVHCLNTTGPACTNEIEKTLLLSTPRLQSRFIAVAFAAFVAAIGVIAEYTGIQSYSNTGRVIPPASVVLSSAQVSKIVNAIGASSSAIVPDPVSATGSLSLVPVPVNRGVLVETESSGDGSLHSLSFIINDPGMSRASKKAVILLKFRQ